MWREGARIGGVAIRKGMSLARRVAGAPLLTGLILTGLTCWFAASAEDSVSVTVVVAAAKQDESPVQVVGFKMPRQSGGVPSIVVRNKTSKEIPLLGLTNYAGNPRGIRGAEPRWGSNWGMRPRADRAPRKLGANASAEYAEDALKPYDVGFWAHRLESNCLHVAFYVTRVDFADGTSWRWDAAEDHEATRARLQKEWKDTIRAESTEACTDSLPTREELNRLDGTTWEPAPAVSNATDEVVQSFSFSCSVRNHAAHCHF